MSGWIKLPRDFLEWQWWHSGNHVRLFLWLYIKAEVTDRRRGNYVIRRGSVLTTWSEMQEAVGIGSGTLGRILNDFKNAGVCITKAECKKTIVTICKYEDYNNDSGGLWSDSGVIAECKRSVPPIINKNREYEKDIYSAREDSDGFVTDADCQAWLQRYNRIARERGYQPCTGITTKRRLYITQRVREKGRGSVDLMFERLAESDYFFSDGSHGFRGDFTNLWTADVYTKVIEGFYIPMRKKPGPQPQQKTVSTIDANVPDHPKQSRRDFLLEWIEEERRSPSDRGQQLLRACHESGELERLGIEWKPNKQ